jgi:broad specificity phosphatase PhoE
MAIHIIRHGETKQNIECLIQGWSDSPLTEKGIADAINVARSIKLGSDPIIVTSNLGRAVSTAQIVRETLGIKDDLVIDPNLRERGFGQYEGRHIDEVYDIVAKMGFKRTPEGIYVAEISGVEPIADIRSRVARVNTNYKGKDLILVGHCLSNNYLREVKKPKEFKFYAGREVVTL